MSKFQDALTTLKTRIANLGNKSFELNESWLKTPDKHPSYAENSLQAIWNIADTFYNATKTTFSSLFLARHYTGLARWFEYLEVGTGALKIDETTYELGVAFKDFLDIATTDPAAKKTLLAGITQLSKIKDILDERLKHYQSHRAEILAIKKYEDNINLALDHSELPIPSLLSRDTNNILVYHMSLAALEDQAARAEADRQSYLTLIEQLNVYAQQLTVEENKLATQHDTFNNTHVLPPEAAASIELLTAKREKACVQLLTRLEETKKQHMRVDELLATAKKELKSINETLAKIVQEEKNSVLETREEQIEMALAKEKSSHENYLEKKHSLETLPNSNELDLEEIKALEKTRRKFLTEANTELTKFNQQLSGAKPRIPPETALKYYLEYDDTNEKELLAELTRPVQKIVDKKPSLWQRLLKRPPHPQVEEISSELLADLKHRIDTKLEHIREELAVDITLPLPIEKSTIASNIMPNDLFSFQQEYQRATQSRLDLQTQENSLLQLELQWRLHAIEYQQALLNDSTTQLEFSLADLQPKQEVLRALLNENGMYPEDALHQLDEHQETITSICEWLESKVDAKLTNKELLASIGQSFSEQESQWLELKAACDATTATSISKDVQDNKIALLEEHETLRHRKTTLDSECLKHQQLINALTIKIQALQLQKITTTSSRCAKLIEIIAKKEPTTLAEKKNLMKDIELQLKVLQEGASYFANLPTNVDPDMTEKQTLILRYQTELLQANEVLQQEIIKGQPEPKVFIPNLKTTAELLTLPKEKFFGVNQPQISGVFGEYLKARADTFWFRDLCGQFTALIFSCFSFQTQAQARKEYIASLHEAVTSYQNDFETYSHLKASIQMGFQKFSPRAKKGDTDYQHSLHAKLTAFYTEIQAIHAEPSIQDISADAPTRLIH